MKVEDALKRLHWRISEQVKKNPTSQAVATDVGAINALVKWVQQQQEINTNKQQLFAKLFVNELTRHFSMTKNLSFSIAHMDHLCKLPLHHYTDLFNFFFNNLKYQMYCDQKKIPHDMPDKFTDEEKNMIIDFIQSDSEFKKYIGGYWPKEKTEESLSNQINDMLHKYSASI